MPAFNKFVPYKNDNKVVIYLLQLVDVEKRCESVTIDLMKMERYTNSLKTDYQLREDQKDLAAAAELRRRENALEKHCRYLELIIDSANADISDLRIKVSASEGRVRGFEGRVAQLEEAKKLADFKLYSVVSSIKRTIIGLRGRSLKEARQQDGQHRIYTCTQFFLLFDKFNKFNDLI